MKLEELDLSERPRNCLRCARITTLRQLLDCTRDDLLGIVNMGDKSVQEIEYKLAQHGLVLKKHDLLTALEGMLMAYGYGWDSKELRCFVYSTKTKTVKQKGNP